MEREEELKAQKDAKLKAQKDAKLKALRLEMDKADEALLKALAERMLVAEKIGLLKKESGKNVLDAKREKEKLEAIREKADERSKPYIEKIYSVLFEASRDLQIKVAEKK
ncbi:MAG: chorismate mutase [Treponemataceae bacterium]|nr:chorismate mutase [Treponemataceae bacterium]